MRLLAAHHCFSATTHRGDAVGWPEDTIAGQFSSPYWSLGRHPPPSFFLASHRRRWPFAFHHQSSFLNLSGTILFTLVGSTT